MDKLMDSGWFMKGISLVLALLLFFSLPHNSKDFLNTNVPSDRSTAVIEDVPVKSYYDTENLVVTGMPETVKVTIEGPDSLVQSTKTLKDFEVYADLSKAEIGKQTVKLKIRDISDKLSVSISPATVDVSVQERVTKEFKVEADFNKAMLQAGVVASDPIVEPNVVKITGAKDVLSQISYVRATLDISEPIKDSITKQAKVQVLDRNLNKLHVTVEPEFVDVTIAVKNISKTVPIKVEQKGSPPSGVTIDEITTDSKEATIIGKQDVLDKTSSVRVEVDVSKITEDTEQTLPVIISDGITKVTPQVVKVKIKVKSQEEKTISNIPIQTEGLSNQYKINYLEPRNGAINLVVYGPSSLVNDLSANDFNIFVDLSSLNEGDHDVNIQVNGPANVNWKLAKETAKISITQKEA